MIRYEENRNPAPCDVSGFAWENTASVRRVHDMLAAGPATPLANLPAFAARAGVRAVLVKDESKRFGLKAFKGLGGTYAMFRIICRELGLDPARATLDELRREPLRSRVRRMTFATTTDGNHGKGVSWAAGLLGCPSYVYMPRGTVEARAQAIRDAGGAVVEITDMRYDDCVACTRDLAERNGWQLIQDTSWPGYEEVPMWIMQGYTTLFFEAVSQMEALGLARPTHLFLQAGVGSMAGAVAGAAVCRYGARRPVIVTVEPDGAACFFESFRRGDGAPHEATGAGDTIMAGLNCATPCPLAWSILRAYGAGALACDDGVTVRGMRLLGRPEGGDPAVVSGESGAVTAGALDAIMTEPACAPLRERLGLGDDAVVLLISTEGDTDPDNYRRVVGP